MERLADGLEAERRSGRVGGPAFSILTSLLLSASSCACVGEVEPAPVVYVDPVDLVPFDAGKADGDLFDPQHLIDDFAFEDGTMLSEEEIEDFFAATPYGRRSPLADMTLEDGRSVAAHIASAALEYRISPIVLLTRMQVEQGLISAQGPLSETRLSKAL